MFRIGEFSKIAQVSKRLLQYYDKIGLFMPEHIGEENGYRYYSSLQLPRLNKILVLKELGLTLEQITQMMNDSISIEEIRGMLALKKSQVEQSVQEEMMQLRYINSRLEQIDTQGTLLGYDIVLKSFPAQRILTVREVLPYMSGFYGLMYEMSLLLPRMLPSGSLSHMIAFIHDDGWEDQEVDAEVGYILNDTDEHDIVTLDGLDSDGYDVQIRTLPAVEAMATAIRVGPGELGSACYHSLARWIEENGYRVIGNGREVFLQFQQGRKEEMVAEIQLPIERVPLSRFPQA
ncbi:MerR family transcriptional regulator [Chloroflexi bacterium TSY]|nr:MerR family transcriptional regulator [Chloroflexi bacterium TSY]